jgi:type VI secretion system lysozyme-like protein
MIDVSPLFLPGRDFPEISNMSVNTDKQNIRSGELFMPCLLNRLTDQAPEQKTENFSRGISLKQLRQNILWNIELILNSRSRPDSGVWHNDPMINDSVLGLGLPDFCGLSHSQSAMEKLRKEIIHQLTTFEPRLEKETLEVNFVNDGTSPVNHSVLELEVSAWIAVEPLREELVFRSKLDLESGIATINKTDEHYL